MSNHSRPQLMLIAAAVLLAGICAEPAQALTRKLESTPVVKKSSKFDPHACTVTVDLRNPAADSGMQYALSGRLFIHKSAGTAHIDPKSVTPTAQGAKLIFDISPAPGACHGPKKMSVDATCAFTQQKNGGKLQAAVDQNVRLADGRATSDRGFTGDAPCPIS